MFKRLGPAVNAFKTFSLMRKHVKNVWGGIKRLDALSPGRHAGTKVLLFDVCASIRRRHACALKRVACSERSWLAVLAWTAVSVASVE